MDRYIVSFSGGKDSTAMLLHMIELGTYQIDEVINFDTGLEFPAMYEHIAKVKAYVESKGIKFTILKADKTFEYYAFEHEFTTRKGKTYKGYGWARDHSRWCTSLLKENLSRKYKKEHQGDTIYQYIGIAYDEQYRLERSHNKQGTHIHPLADWKWTEKDALKYCYDHGYDFGGLYNIFDRVSCWCCPLQKISELKKLWQNFPSLWQQLKEWEKMTDMPFRTGYSIDMLETRFKLENERDQLGLSNNPHTKEFRLALKERLDKLPPHCDRIKEKQELK